MDAVRQVRRVIRFGIYELDVQAHELRKRGSRIHLQEQPFQILSLLVERQGQAVSREFLRESLWPGGTFVEFEHSLNTAVNKLRAALEDDAGSPQFIETVPRVGYRFVAPVEVVREGTREEAQPTFSIAVLPFANLSKDKEDQYFSDGLAEEILNALAQVPGLRVVARTSAFFFRDKDVDIREIGVRLNVNHILEGSVRKEGDRIRVTLQLINALDGYHFWSERYDRRMAGIFDVQDEISQAVADRLRVQFGKGQPVVKRQTASLEAYDQYLKGRHLRNQFTGQGWRKAIECFERAVIEDPDYAAPRAGLAVAYTYLAIHGWARPREVMPAAKECALAALELDETLPEAHCALGFIRTFYEWDWQGAESEYHRAMELDPRDALIRIYYSLLLMYTGRVGPAFAEARRAWELEPISEEVNRLMVYIAFVTGRYEEAVAHGRSAVELYPHGAGVHNLLGFAYVHKGQYQEAVRSLQEASALTDGDPLFNWGLGYGYARQGRRSEALAIAELLEPRRSKNYFPPTLLAGLYGVLGELARAFELLDTAYETRDGFLVTIGVDPTFQWLRADPRCRAVLKKIKLAS